MVDIHAHILPMIDDGSASFNDSLSLVKTAAEMGVTDIVCTPHYRGEYNKSPSEVKTVFEKFNENVKAENVPVRLYPGQEIFIDRNFKKNFAENRFITMNGTDFILIEFDFNHRCEISQTVYELKMMGYKPIVAHLERYYYADMAEAYEIKKLGAFIQVNAESVIGVNRHRRKFVKTMFKEGFVDFVASDVHCGRVNRYADAERYVRRKFGDSCADKVFSTNAEQIIKG